MKKYILCLFLILIGHLAAFAQCSNDNIPPNLAVKDYYFFEFSGHPIRTFYAIDFVSSLSDNCSDSVNIALKIRHVNGISDTFVSRITLLCGQIHPDSFNIFELKATDEQGNSTIVQKIISLNETGLINCYPDLRLYIQAKTEQGEGIGSSIFHIIGTNTTLLPPFEMYANSDSNGFNRTPGLSPGLRLKIDAQRNDNPLNGISTIDLLNINKHILHVTHLNSPYKILAADVNDSKSITTFDILTLRKLILGIIDTFPDGKSWRFVDKYLTFYDPLDPFAQPFDFTIDTILTPNTTVATTVTKTGFVGYKIGDVNGSALPLNAPPPATEDRIMQPLWMENALLTAGETATIPVYAGSSDWQGFQFALQFDPTLMHLEKVLPSEWKGFGEEAYALPKAGLLTVSWFDAEGRPAPSDEPLFYLKIKALANMTLSETIRFSTEKIWAEAYGQNERSVNIGLEFIEKPHPSLQKMEVIAIVPNPTTTGATVPIWLKEDANVTLKVMDMAGNVVKLEALPLTAGRHRLSINATDLPHSGVWTVQIGYGETVSTQRLIKL